jgi:hypothetical protein
MPQAQDTRFIGSNPAYDLSQDMLDLTARR